jgi:DNA-binding response OmpR family regulator
VSPSGILLVEDDEAIASGLVRVLESQGYSVRRLARGGRALAAAADGQVGLVILDLGLPDSDGIDVCRRLRTARPDLAILILTARDQELDVVAGLDAGADDYLTKPFRLAELLARVRALLRRGTTEPAQPSTHGVRIDVESHRAWMGDDELQLTAKEFDLLRVLVRDAGRVVTREQLMREVWDTTWWSSTKTLDMHISWLRRKLAGDEGRPDERIITVRGVGFRFAADASDTG